MRHSSAVSKTLTLEEKDVSRDALDRFHEKFTQTDVIQARRLPFRSVDELDKGLFLEKIFEEVNTLLPVEIILIVACEIWEMC